MIILHITHIESKLHFNYNMLSFIFGDVDLVLSSRQTLHNWVFERVYLYIALTYCNEGIEDYHDYF